MDRSEIGFVVGLTAEARLLRGAGFRVGIGGGTPEGAGRAAATLVATGAAALVSFGLAGGLNPALPPGSLVVPTYVIEGETRFQCDSALVNWLGGATTESLLAGVEIAITAAQKSALFSNAKAAAIDLESGAVARVAKTHNLPFAVLRAVADPAARTLPSAALIALNAAGNISLLPILASVLRNPAQIPTLLALGRDAAQARAALLKKLRQIQGF
jgi:adenosylhomocysteine nucleosidase